MEAARHITFVPRRSRIAEWLDLARMDGVMVAASLGLAAFGLFTLATGTGEGESSYFLIRQALYVVAGVGLMLGIARLDYTRLRGPRVTLYAAMVGSILLVLIAGAAVRGSQRWIELPLFRLQPSELAKVLLCVSLAAFTFERMRRPPRLTQTLVLLSLALAPTALVLLQPDLGTAIVLVVIGLAMLYVGGVPWQHFAAIGAAALAIAGGALALGSAVGFDVLHGYQEDRLTSFLHPSDDPADSSYQVNQAVIAVGSGEVVGRGADSTQTELLFLPERRTDFIFAVIGERFGFLGSALVIAFYAALLWRAIRVLRISASFYGTLIASGIVAMLGFQAIVNAGMNLGMLPVTGMPLPLVSYGGSSVIATFIALGLLQSIHAHAQRG